MKDNQMIISIATERAFDKIQHPYRIKTLNRLATEGIYLNIIKFIYDKPAAKFPLRSERQGCPHSLFLLNIVLHVLARAIRQD